MLHVRLAIPLTSSLLVFSSFVQPAGSIQAPATAPPYGAESPQAVVAALERATASHDPGAMVALISPSGRRQLAQELVTDVLIVLRMTNPDGLPQGIPPRPATELEVERTTHGRAVDLARQTLAPHGLDEFIGSPPLADDVVTAMGAALDRTDTVRLLAAVIPLLGQLGGVLGFEDAAPPPFVMDLGPVTDYEIASDRATAKAASETLEFERIDGRWYLAPPAGAPPGRR